MVGSPMSTGPDERQQARLIAERLLSHPWTVEELAPGKPGAEAIILARQFLRALEFIGAMKEIDTSPPHARLGRTGL